LRLEARKQSLRCVSLLAELVIRVQVVLRPPLWVQPLEYRPDRFYERKRTISAASRRGVERDEAASGLIDRLSLPSKLF
jgi:hypothetical protein